jgi:hypothetical protein
MRPQSAVSSLALGAGLLVAFAVGCAPSEQPPADTAIVPVDARVDSITASPAATATPLPAALDSGTRAPAASGTAVTRATPRTTGATPATRGAATDTSTGPRLRPPAKAPGGYILVPNSAHDSLRMAPPATSTGTSTRP